MSSSIRGSQGAVAGSVRRWMVWMPMRSVESSGSIAGTLSLRAKRSNLESRLLRHSVPRNDTGRGRALRRWRVAAPGTHLDGAGVAVDYDRFRLDREGASDAVGYFVVRADGDALCAEGFRPGGKVGVGKLHRFLEGAARVAHVVVHADGAVHLVV